MAQQKSILKLRGTIGGISFYKSKDGYLAREKGGVDASRIANDPGFARTRENGAEFGNSASAGKLLRDAVRTLGKDASDGRVTARLTQIMSQIKNLDVASNRGERSVDKGIATNDGKLLLKGFNFNSNAALGTVLYKPFEVNALTGSIIIASIIPQKDISIPDGATHVILRSGCAIVDFVTGNSEMGVSDPVRLTIGADEQPVNIVPQRIPFLEGIKFILLSIDFVQVVNNVDYSLNNNAYNVLAIVEVV